MNNLEKLMRTHCPKYADKARMNEKWHVENIGQHHQLKDSQKNALKAGMADKLAEALEKIRNDVIQNKTCQTLSKEELLILDAVLAIIDANAKETLAQWKEIQQATEGKA